MRLPVLLVLILAVACSAHRINPNTYAMGLVDPVWSDDGRILAMRDISYENGGIHMSGPVCIFDAHTGRLLDRTHDGLPSFAVAPDDAIVIPDDEALSMWDW